MALIRFKSLGCKAPVGCPMDVPECYRSLVSSKSSQERHDVSLFGGRKFRFDNQIEKLHGIVQSQQTPVMQVRRRVLDPAQREGLDRPVTRGHPALDQTRLEESFHAKVVHQIVCVIWSRMTGSTPGFPEEQ